MKVDGVWVDNFIEKYAPALQWGAGPFPYTAGRPDLKWATAVEASLIVIPTGAAHPREAFEFLKFTNTQPIMEFVSAAHTKSSPLAKVSKEFITHHRHPAIQVFQRSMASPNAFIAPQTGVWPEYSLALSNAFDMVVNQHATPEDALQRVQARMQEALERDQRLLARRRRER